MNIDVSNPKYTLEEIAAQCKHAINNGRLRGKVAQVRTHNLGNVYIGRAYVE